MFESRSFRRDLRRIWIEATKDATIVLHVEGRRPLKLSGMIGLVDLLRTCVRLAASRAQSGVLPVMSPDPGVNGSASSFRSFMPAPRKPGLALGSADKQHSGGSGESSL